MSEMISMEAVPALTSVEGQCAGVRRLCRFAGGRAAVYSARCPGRDEPNEDRGALSRRKG